MKSALMLIVDANDTAKVRGMLDDAISFMCERHDNGRAFFEKGVAVFPAFGMLGTVVGLVNMLNTMDSNPEGLADGMATALYYYVLRLTFCERFVQPYGERASKCPQRRAAVHADHRGGRPCHCGRLKPALYPGKT